MSSNITTPLGLGIVGCGRVVDRRVAPAIRAVDGAQLAAFCSRELSRAQEYAQTHGAAAAYDRLDAMLADDRVEAVYVATPNRFHAATAIACLEAGRHVLVDKPMALNTAEARMMIDAANRSGRRLGLLHQQRFHPVHRRLFELVRDGRLGRILSVRVQMGFWYNLADNWRTRREMSGGGPAMDLAPHAFDILHRIVGPVRRIDARTYLLHFNYEVEDHCAARMEFDGGAVGTAEFSYCSHHYGGRLEVYGSEGTFIADGTLQQAERYRLWLRFGTDERPMEEGSASSCFGRIISDFASAVREGREPTVGMSDGLDVMRVLDAMYESARCEYAIEVA